MTDGVGLAVKVIVVTVIGVTGLFQGAGTSDVLGPVGISQEIGRAAQVGLSPLLMLAAYLSVTLGLINLFPIPALDGSRLVFLAVEAVRGRPVNPEKENLIHFLGFALLMLLMLGITYRDLLRISTS